MTPESRQKLRSLLLQHESFRQYPYSDTTGHITIGIGRNLSDRGISQAEAFSLLDDDVLYFSSKLSQLFVYFDVFTKTERSLLSTCVLILGLMGSSTFMICTIVCSGAISWVHQKLCLIQNGRNKSDSVLPP